MRSVFASLARKHAVESILSFVIVNADDMRDESSKYYQDKSKETFVFFKEGKQVAVNGKRAVEGSDKKALTAAVLKLSGLAQKRLAEQNKAEV
jgi:thioredoxin 1